MIIKSVTCDFRKLDQLKLYFGLYFFMAIIYDISGYFYEGTGAPESNFGSAFIIPILEEMIYRLITIGLLFFGLKSGKLIRCSVFFFKFFLVLITLLHLLAIMNVIYINPANMAYWQIVVILTSFISLCIVIISIRLFNRTSTDNQLLYLLIFSSSCFSIIHALEDFIFRAIPPFFFGIMSGILFINKANLQNREKMSSKKVRIFYLLFGYAAVTSIHVWHNLVDWLITGFLECLLTKLIGVLLLLLLIQYSIPGVTQVVRAD